MADNVIQTTAKYSRSTKGYVIYELPEGAGMFAQVYVPRARTTAPPPAEITLGIMWHPGAPVVTNENFAKPERKPREKKAQPARPAGPFGSNPFGTR